METTEELRARQRAGHDPNERACGLMCHKHFDQHDATWGEVDNCPNCLQAERDEDERIQRNHTIDPTQPYGQHVSLTCKNHPHLRWSTKNIDFIGARSIFYFGQEPECDCSARDLILVPKEDAV